MADRTIPTEATRQDALYEEAAADYGAALERLARAYEADADKRRDLLQEIHVAMWRSFAKFDGRCSPRTWVYRVAHNTATTHVMQQARAAKMMGIEELEELPDTSAEGDSDRREALERLLALIQKLRPLDRQLMVSYLEGMDAAAIGEITGLSATNVATKIHRVKALLARRFQEGGGHGD